FNKVFYSSIQNHLGELIVSITKSSEDSNFEKQLWQLIRDILIAKLNDIANDIDDQQRVKNIKSILLATKLDYKCVTTLRLTDQADYYHYINVDKPLHQKKIYTIYIQKIPVKYYLYRYFLNYALL